MADIRFYLATDDARYACLSVFGIGLYGLPEWAAIADTADAIEAIPDGAVCFGVWHFGSSESHRLQRMVTLRRAAGELKAPPTSWFEKIEKMIEERDRIPAASAANPAMPARESTRGDGPEIQARASKWH